MSKTRRIRYNIIGQGNECPKCRNKMERREHKEIPTTKTYYFKKWDYCQPCGHLQHYEEFKSSAWQEDERQQSFLKSI